MAGRFVLGAAVGLGGSFAILQKTTDRRIISLMRPEEEARGASVYQYRLYREMYDMSRPAAESDVAKSAKAYWNSGVTGFSGLLKSITSLGKSKEPEVKEEEKK